jgi:hypothetical protein
MTLRTAVCLLACTGPVVLGAAGCESTQSKSQKLAKKGAKAITGQKGLAIERKSRVARVLSASVLHDANGTAAVVVVRNTTNRPLGRVPLSIDVTAARKSVFKNDDPGLEPSLTGIASMRPRQTMAWVNDQVLSEAKATAVTAVAGAGSGSPPRSLPDIAVGPPKLGGDPTSGIAAEGPIRNRSKLEQKKLVLFAVAIKGDKVVAAGRGQIERLKPGRKANYQIFFIGNPRGARIQVVAPPTRTS